MGAVKLYLHLEKMLMKKNQYSKKKLAEFGYENIVDYVFDICKMTLEEI